MTSYRNRDAVKKLSQKYGMPESYVRQMLAIENGEISGDVIEVDSHKTRHRMLGWAGRCLVFVLTTLGLAHVFYGSTQQP